MVDDTGVAMIRVSEAVPLLPVMRHRSTTVVLEANVAVSAVLAVAEVACVAKLPESVSSLVEFDVGSPFSEQAQVEAPLALATSRECALSRYVPAVRSIAVTATVVLSGSATADSR